MPQVKKICVDSRFANALSKSNTDFKMDLTDSITLPDNTAVIITDISIPHSWYSIEYFNENFYFRVVEPDEVDEGVTFISDYRVQLTRQNYDIRTLVAELVRLMNDAYGSDIFSGRAVLELAKIEISIAGDRRKFYIFSDKDLLNRVNATWNGPDFDSFRPNTCNAVIGFNSSYDFSKPLNCDQSLDKRCCRYLGHSQHLHHLPSVRSQQLRTQGGKEHPQEAGGQCSFRGARHRELAQRSRLHGLLETSTQNLGISNH